MNRKIDFALLVELRCKHDMLVGQCYLCSATSAFRKFIYTPWKPKKKYPSAEAKARDERIQIGKDQAFDKAIQVEKMLAHPGPALQKLFATQRERIRKRYLPYCDVKIRGFTEKDNRIRYYHEFHRLPMWDVARRVKLNKWTCYYRYYRMKRKLQKCYLG